MPSDLSRAVPWPEFATKAPELAERGAAMLRAFTLAYLATLRPDGSPRIHPVTVTIDNSGLYVYTVASTPKGATSVGTHVRSARVAIISQ